MSPHRSAPYTKLQTTGWNFVCHNDRTADTAGYLIEKPDPLFGHSAEVTYQGIVSVRGNKVQIASSIIIFAESIYIIHVHQRLPSFLIAFL